MVEEERGLEEDGDGEQGMDEEENGYDLDVVMDDEYGAILTHAHTYTHRKIRIIRRL